MSRNDGPKWPVVTPDPTSGREPDWDDDYHPVARAAVVPPVGTTGGSQGEVYAEVARKLLTVLRGAK